MLYNDSPQLNNPNLNFEIQILQHFFFYLLQICKFLDVSADDSHFIKLIYIVYSTIN
jgi:hypothetical protein